MNRIVIYNTVILPNNFGVGNGCQDTRMISFPVTVVHSSYSLNLSVSVLYTPCTPFSFVTVLWQFVSVACFVWKLYTITPRI